MHIKRFTKGSAIRFLSQRTGEEMLAVIRSEPGYIEYRGTTPRDDVRVQMDGSAVDIRGLLYDTEGPVVRFNASDTPESYVDCMMEIAPAGRPMKRALLATPETFHRTVPGAGDHGTHGSR